MSRFSELLVQDKANNLLCYIDPDECNECYTDKEVNGSNTMKISIDVNSYSAQYLKKDNRVMFHDYDKNKWYEYIISETSVNNEELQVNLESSLYITLANVIEFVDVTGRTVINGMQEAFDAAVPKPQWSPGVSDIHGSFYMQRTRVTLKEWIFDWTEKVSGELEEEITIINGIVVRKVNIKSSIGKDLGKTLYDDRDITDIDITDPTRTVYTAAFGYGKSETIDDTGESKPITFEDIEWKVENGDPVDKPIGQKWIELPEEYKEKYGYYDTDKVLQNSFCIYKEDNVEVKEELIERTYQFLIDNVEDKTEYRISAIDFYSLAGEGIEINLGDTIGVVVKQLNYKMYRVKVKRYKEDLIDKGNNDFELNNSATDIIDVINDSENNYSEIKDKVDGLVNKGLTESVLDGWNEEINKDSGYLIYASPQDGLVAYNAETPELSTKATQIKGGSVRVANTKTNGAFNWTTVMTGDGLIATALYTGSIKGDKFEIDLDSGLVKMGLRNTSGIIDDPSFQLNQDGSISIKILSQYSTTEEMNAAIELNSQNLSISFSDILNNNYYTNDRIDDIIHESENKQSDYVDNSILNTKEEIREEYKADISISSQELQANFNSKLLSYSTTEEMNAAISASSDSLKVSFNKTLENYDTKDEVSSKIYNSEVKIEEEYTSALEITSQNLKQEFNSSISAVQMGNNNMMPGTSFYNTDGLSWKNSDNTSEATFDATENSKFVSGRCAVCLITKSGTGEVNFNKHRVNLKKGVTYTLSLILMYTGGSKQFEVGLKTTSNGVKTVEYSGGFLNIVHTFTPSSDDTYPSLFMIKPVGSVDEQRQIIFGDIKLIEGDKATNWTPAANDVTDALTGYVTDENLDSALSNQARILTNEFNEKLNSYPTKIDMNGAIETSAAGLISKFNATLTNYSTTLQMNSAISQSANSIMLSVNEKVGKTEVGTYIQQNSNAVRIAWNNYTQYIQFEQSRLNIYENGTGDMLLFSLGSSGMKFYKNDNSAFIGQIGTNQLKDYPDYKGLDFDLSQDGTYMTWAAKKSSTATTYTIALAYSNKEITNLPKGLSVGDSLDMRHFQLKNANIVNSTLDGKSIVVSHGGVASMGFVYYTNGTPQNYGYVEVATTDRGMVGLSAWQSDGRLKKNISKSEKCATDIINKIDIREFDWKEDNSHEDFGIIAQELENINENYVFKVKQRDDEGNVVDEIYQIRTEKLIPIIIKSIQELYKKVYNLEDVSFFNDNVIEQYESEVKYNVSKETEFVNQPLKLMSKRDKSGNVEFVEEE